MQCQYQHDYKFSTVGILNYFSKMVSPKADSLEFILGFKEAQI